MQFQRFQGISKTDRGKLRASFRGGTVAPGRRAACLGKPRTRSPTRPHTYRLPLSPAWFPTNVARNSPNRPSNFEIGSLQFQRFLGTSKTDRGKLRASFREGTVAPAAARPARSSCRRPALPATRLLFLPPAREIAAHPHGSPKMSHVIPRTILQTLKSGRCNSNVFSAHQKLTEGNYVRVLEESTCQRTRVSCLPTSRRRPASRGRPEPGARPSDNPGTLAAQTAYGVRIDNTGSGILVA